MLEGTRRGVALAALLALAACSDTAPNRANASFGGAARANSPADAAKQYVIAVARNDATTVKALTCRHGWTGGGGIHVSVPAGRYTWHAHVRRIAAGWQVVLSANQPDLGTTMSPLRVVRKDGTYLVCGMSS